MSWIGTTKDRLKWTVQNLVSNITGNAIKTTKNVQNLRTRAFWDGKEICQWLSDNPMDFLWSHISSCCSQLQSKIIYKIIGLVDLKKFGYRYCKEETA